MPSLKFPMLFELPRSILDSIFNFVINTMLYASSRNTTFMVHCCPKPQSDSLWCIVSLVLKSYHNLRPKDAPHISNYLRITPDCLRGTPGHFKTVFSLALHGVQEK